MKITIIGNGTMGGLIKDALLKKHVFAQKDLFFIGRDDATTPNADIYLIAVKPQDFSEAAKRLKGVKGKILISIMAGIPTSKIAKVLPGNKVVRSMPNLGAKSLSSMTTWMTKGGSSKKNNLYPAERKMIKSILSSFGEELEVKNDDMIDKATALAGSGPGFMYFIADALTKQGVKFGFSKDDSQKLIKQMFTGTINTWNSSTETAAELQKKVTSKKGTTEAGINSFKKNKLTSVLSRGLVAAYKRAKQLSKQ
ncbi:MAG TPA: pyrroline-5-carboxylate reductase [Candidatus Gracilibacteria bacterium]|mgnify:CR=1 FL=1|nr:pyrroline-5-carboxylate reductase [Candidatus Gracilibacteria bacterium]